MLQQQVSQQRERSLEIDARIADASLGSAGLDTKSQSWRIALKNTGELSFRSSITDKEGMDTGESSVRIPAGGSLQVSQVEGGFNLSIRGSDRRELSAISLRYGLKPQLTRGSLADIPREP